MLVTAMHVIIRTHSWYLSPEQTSTSTPCMSVQVYMCANEWQDVRYTRVPSVCMKNNKGSFEKHDEERFTQYLQDVKAGKKTIASGALKPHELVAEAMQHTW